MDILKYKTCYFIFVTCLQIICANFLLVGQDNKVNKKKHAKVLVLHSYHKGYKWTDDISKGIEDKLSSDVILYTDYLDTKRNQFDDTYFKILFQSFKYKLLKHKFNLIVCSDNNALDFLKRCRDSIASIPPIVFCGVNELTGEELAGFQGFTGVNEKADVEKGLNLISELHPERKNLLVITDVTVTGQRVKAQVENVITDDKCSFNNIEIVDNISMKSLLSKVGKLKDDFVVYYTFFFRDSLGVFYEYDESARLISEKCSVPVYSAWDFNLGCGIVGGYLVSGYQQGAKAADLAKQVLSGISVDELSVVMESPNQYAFDFMVLKKFNIDISDLKRVDKLINKPVTIFEKYPELVFSTIILFVFLIIIILLLVINTLIKKKAAKQIRIGKEHLATTLNSIGDGVISTDNLGRIINMNRVAEKLTGWVEQEGVFKQLNEVFKIIQSKTNEPVYNIVGQVLKSGKVLHISSKNKLIARTGKEYYISSNAAPIIDQRNQVNGIVIVFRDITEEHFMTKALKASEKKFRKYIQASSIAVCQVDENNYISFANSSAEQLTGYSLEELRNTEFFNLLENSSLGESLKHYKEIGKTGKIKDVEVIIKQKSGDEIFAIIDGVRLNKTSYIFYCRSINELKKIQGDLAEKNEEYKALTEELERRIVDLKELNAKLEESKERAETSDRLKTAFLANMSHEIRTPLNGIMGFSSLLDDPALSPAKQKKFIKVIQKSGERILSIFNHIIDISKIEAGQTQVAYDAVNLVEIVNYHYEFFKPLARDKGLDIRLLIPSSKPFIIKTDKIKLEQILTNLLKNAIKFTKSGYIELGYKPKNKFIEFFVKDTGIGIDSGMHELIFKRFMQVGAIDGSFHDGAGLGLSISKAYVNLLGGEIRVESKPEVGSTFYFTLPHLSFNFKISNSSV